MYIDSNMPKIMNEVQIECEHPGQTMMIALAIMLNFESFQEANSQGETFTKATECKAVPGVGDAIYTALDALEHGIENNLDSKSMIDYCKVKWKEFAEHEEHEEKYKGAIEPGNKRAEPFIKAFASEWNKWKQQSTTQ